MSKEGLEAVIGERSEKAAAAGRLDAIGVAPKLGEEIEDACRLGPT